MAAVESRLLVCAAAPFRKPKCAEANVPHKEREQKTEQQLEAHGTIERISNGKYNSYLTRGADSQKRAKTEVRYLAIS